jgi:hypothetical protein
MEQLLFTLSEALLHFASLQAGNSSDRTWDIVQDELSRIQDLRDDWDGAGADAPAKEVIQNCLQLMNACRSSQVPPPDLVHPTPDGNVALEWLNKGERIEFEVSEDSLEFMSFDASGKTTYRHATIG